MANHSYSPKFDAPVADVGSRIGMVIDTIAMLQGLFSGQRDLEAFDLTTRRPLEGLCMMLRGLEDTLLEVSEELHDRHMKEMEEKKNNIPRSDLSNVQSTAS